jgi:hypothetical protein
MIPPSHRTMKSKMNIGPPGALSMIASFRSPRGIVYSKSELAHRRAQAIVLARVKCLWMVAEVRLRTHADHTESYSAKTFISITLDIPDVIRRPRRYIVVSTTLSGSKAVRRRNIYLYVWAHGALCDWRTNWRGANALLPGHLSKKTSPRPDWVMARKALGRDGDKGRAENPTADVLLAAPAKRSTGTRCSLRSEFRTIAA